MFQHTVVMDSGLAPLARPGMTLWRQPEQNLGIAITNLLALGG
jgi:hypothetical protein